MSAGRRWLLALAAAIVVTGLVGIAVHTAPSRHVTDSTSTTVPRRAPATSTTRPTSDTGPPTTSAGPPGPGSATLSANLLVPNDFGGYFDVEPAQGAAFLASAPCLAGLQPSPSQSGRAVTALVDTVYHQLPVIVEVVTSYPGDGNMGMYRALLTTLGACHNFAASIGGSTVTVAMAPAQMAAVGEASSLYQGQFAANGRTEQLSIAVAADNGEVVLIGYLDSLPPATSFFGGVAATLSAAIGNES